MLIYRAMIDSREYFLATPQEADTLKKDVLKAVRAGGEFIEARSSRSRASSILVTSSTPVVFEVHESEEQSRTDPAQTYVDFDQP